MRPMHEGVSAAVALLAALPAAAQLWIAPRAGDTVLMRRPLLLQWNAAPGTVATLSYSLDTGRSWTLLQRDLEVPSYRWDVPVLDTVALLLRLHLESATSSALVAERRRAHTAPIRCVRFSPEGRYLVTTAEDGIVKLWTVPELEASDVLVIGTPALLSAAFLRDSTQVVVSVDSLLLLYDRVSKVRRFFGAGVHRGVIRDIAAHPTGTLLATAADDSALCVWELAQLQPIARFAVPQVSSWYSVAFSLDGELLAAGGNDGNIYVWRWREQGAPLQFGRHGDSLGNRVVWSVAFGTEEGLLLSGGVDGTVRIWDVYNGRERARALGHRFHVRSVRALPWGRRLLSAALDSTLRQWTPSGTPLGAPLWHGGAVLSADYSPDGRWIASVGRDSALRLWSSGAAQEETLRVVLKYPLRLRVAQLEGRVGEQRVLEIGTEDVEWIPPLQERQFSSRLTIRLPAWLCARLESGQPRPALHRWDTLQLPLSVPGRLSLPLLLLDGHPQRAALEPLQCVVEGTEAFRAELIPGELLVHTCRDSGHVLLRGEPSEVSLQWNAPQLCVQLRAGEDGAYELELFSVTGERLWHSGVQWLRAGTYQWCTALHAAAGWYVLVCRTPSRLLSVPFSYVP